MDHVIPRTIDELGHMDRLVPPPWTCADPDTFAWTVLHERHPALLRGVAAAHPYPSEHHEALDQLLEESTHGVLRPLPDDRHDAAVWAAWTGPHVGKRWVAAPFLLAESYFYRRFLDATGFFRPGPWFWIDPFGHQKDAELADPTLADELAALDELPAFGTEERFRALLGASVWGNRADLGFAAHRGPPAVMGDATGTALLVDDTDAVIAALHDDVGQVILVADNAGRELLADLLLIDELVAANRAATVTVHVKPTPYYVSDATTTDVAACLRRLARAGGQAGSVADRLREAFARDRVALATHWFYTAPLEYRAMPRDLAESLTGAELVILKGDLNYRRVFGDRHWPSSTSADFAGDYFPSPFVVLRTLKSDVVVGVDEADTTLLDAQVPGWRTAGTHALVQHVAPPSR